ncbi:MAG: hypothetical protein ACC642_05135, partial [Pseudomonadales bacterium]
AIHFVLGTDAQTGMARCSRLMSDEPGITYLPMIDVWRLLADGDRDTVDAELVIPEPAAPSR